MVVPEANAITLPVLLIVATVVLVELQLPLVVTSANVDEAPVHILVVPVIGNIVGTVLTVIEVVVLDEPQVPVIV